MNEDEVNEDEVNGGQVNGGGASGGRVNGGGKLALIAAGGTGGHMFPAQALGNGCWPADGG